MNHIGTEDIKKSEYKLNPYQNMTVKFNKHNVRKKQTGIFL